MAVCWGSKLHPSALWRNSGATFKGGSNHWHVRRIAVRSEALQPRSLGSRICEGVWNLMRLVLWHGMMAVMRTCSRLPGPLAAVPTTICRLHVCQGGTSRLALETGKKIH